MSAFRPDLLVARARLAREELFGRARCAAPRPYTRAASLRTVLRSSICACPRPEDRRQLAFLVVCRGRERLRKSRGQHISRRASVLLLHLGRGAVRHDGAVSHAPGPEHDAAPSGVVARGRSTAALRAYAELSPDNHRAADFSGGLLTGIAAVPIFFAHAVTTSIRARVRDRGDRETPRRAMFRLFARRFSRWLDLSVVPDVPM